MTCAALRLEPPPLLDESQSHACEGLMRELQSTGRPVTVTFADMGHNEFQHGSFAEEDVYVVHFPEKAKVESEEMLRKAASRKWDPKPIEGDWNGALFSMEGISYGDFYTLIEQRMVNEQGRNERSRGERASAC